MKSIKNQQSKIKIMTAPKIYRYDDDNAPVMRGEREAVTEVLTACLVDGYGDKEAAGWTRPFVNAEGTKAVFRNDPAAGSGMFLQVDSSLANGEVFAHIYGYENMTDVDTGVFPFLSLGYKFYNSQYRNSEPRPWLLIGDERFFYLFSWRQDTLTNFDGQKPAVGICFFGDGISIHDSDPYFCMIMGGWPYGSHDAYLNYFDGAPASGQVVHERDTKIAVARNSAGDAGPCRPYLCSGGGPVERLPGSGSSPEIMSRKVFSRHYLNDGIPRSIRGYIPGLWAPCFSASAVDNFEIISVDGHQFYAVHHGPFNGSNNLSLIDISANWRP